MTRLIFSIICSLAFSGLFSQTSLFDNNWRFHRGGAQGAEKPEFNDSDWRMVDLPHDWSIEDLPGTNSPFEPNAISQVSGGFTTGGTGWYRKSVTFQSETKGKRILLQFDGIYMNSQCWINGILLAEHPYGYTSFWLDITDHVKSGENVIAVQVRNEGQNSRWYTGSGIYRHVWLKVLDPVHVAQWGTYVTTPEVSTTSAKINVTTSVINSDSVSATVRLISRIVDQHQLQVISSESEYMINSGSANTFDQNMIINNPTLWDTEHPVLYTVISEVYIGGRLTDRTETPFGIRSISFDATNGFRLNGKTIKLRGGCVHHDNGPLGARAYDRAEERRVELLKASGFNAIRCAHNPPSPSFLDACDRLGMLVIDETFDMWRIANNPYDYHLYFDDWWQKDVSGMLERDRNHPSIILWSIGNEIRDMESAAVIETGKKLADFIHKAEPTRPVLAAVNNLRPQKDPFFSILDVCGYNYAAGGDHGQVSIYVQDHARVPERIMVGTESYAMEAFGAWMPVLDNSWVIGDFVWTAFDYIGEASIGWLGYWQESSFFPWNLAYCGDIDICGWKRPQSYYRDALWKPDQVSVFVNAPTPSFALNPKKQSWSKWEWHDVVPSWTWTGYEGQSLDVTVYSSCPEAELFVNGKSFGKKVTDRSTEFSGTWKVPYTAGEIKVAGLRGKKTVATSVLKTAGPAETIKLTADRLKIKADNQDLCYITIELTDRNGVINPLAENEILFKIEGEGSLISVANANPVSTESYQLPRRKAWRGKCLAIVKSTGNPGSIRLTAFSEGLSEAVVEIVTE
jgi:beta-galactosidase